MEFPCTPLALHGGEGEEEEEGGVPARLTRCSTWNVWGCLVGEKV